MATAKKARPNLGNATLPFLIDEVGDLREKQAEIKDSLAYYEEALKARLPKSATTFEGEKKCMTITSAVRTGLVTEKVKEVLQKLYAALEAEQSLPENAGTEVSVGGVTFADLDACEGVTSYVTMRFKNKG